LFVSDFKNDLKHYICLRRSVYQLHMVCFYAAPQIRDKERFGILCIQIQCFEWHVCPFAQVKSA